MSEGVREQGREREKGKLMKGDRGRERYRERVG